MTRRRPAALDGPEIPPELTYLWRTFQHLEAGRQGTGFGPLPLSPLQIQSHFALYRETPEVWELDLIRRLDGLSLVAMQPDPPKST